MARLRLIGQAGHPNKEFDLKDSTSLGRHPSQDIQVLDRVVSKEHARIVRREGLYYLADLGSRNGTFLNGTRVTRTMELHPGDEIRMGGSSLVFLGEAGQDPTLLGQVTIASEGEETNIQERLAGAGGFSFLPETQIHDEQQLRRDYEKLRIAMELSQDLGIERDLDRLLNRILDRAFSLFAADRAVILLIDEASGQLVPRHVKNRAVQSANEKINISKTVLREVFQEKAGVLSSDAVMDKRFASAHSIILSGIRSTMSVPLLFKDKLLGIIYLDSLMSTGAFTERDLQLLSGFANQAAVAIENSRLVASLEQEALARSRLGRLLSPNLVNQVVSGALEVKQGGELRKATVLFSDIRGFTSMTERTPAQEVVSLLNAYFEVMVDIVFKYEGTLDKFVGDEIMAIWGAPVAQDNCALRAVLTALEMRAALIEFNKVMTADGFPNLEVGIGVNTGEMVCGYMGSSKTMEYTVIGDSVNLGARLCSAATPMQILISESTFLAVRDKIPIEQKLSLNLKGKTGMIPVYVVGEIKKT
ncbi:MAG: adenylate/guanylate cyclase domain-containing protein [Myxococcota bacterium]|jgi:adenylate cyclase|nr:adenylate/guanylate cyclase domain-containing protein [Myxococcota bacterium]